MDISVVDRSATLGTSALHRVAPRAKLLAAGLVLISVIVSTNVLVIVAVAAVLVTALLMLRLPWRPLLGLALYPGLFAALYAFAAGVGAWPAATIVAKAVTSALTVLVLMFTTPYPQVFAPLQRIMPGVIGDALLMTYRSLFLLLEKFGHTLTAARLRAGVVGANPARSAVTITRSLGGVLLYSIDLSQRTHDIMHLRGYDGRLVVTAAPSESVAAERATLLGAVGVLVLAVVWRVWWPALNPYAWLLPLAGGCALVVAALRTLPRRSQA